MSYETFFYNARWWITLNGNLLAGYNANDLRPYIFPFYTPDGMLVVQESPPDHLHHQGICVGLEVDGHDMWNAGSFGKARHSQQIRPALADLKPAIDVDGVTISHAVDWQSDAGISLLAEERRITISSAGEVNLVTWHSTFTAFKPTTIGQTKESGIGVRVTPHWETRLGGRIRNAEGGIGEAGCFDKMSTWVNVEGKTLGGGKAGVVLCPLPDTETCRWFTRDYGLQVYNPARHHPIELVEGESFSWHLQVAAYDGGRSIGDIKNLLK